MGKWAGGHSFAHQHGYHSINAIEKPDENMQYDCLISGSPKAALDRKKVH